MLATGDAVGVGVAGATDSTGERSTVLPQWLWLWTPVALLFATIVTLAIDPDLYERVMLGELGVVESATALFLFVAILAAVDLIRMRARVVSKAFVPFVFVMALGCMFFLGEEVSWGQHWFGFEPPEEIAERNEQGELNFHNDPELKRYLSRLPRTLLTLAAWIGGVFVPLLRLLRRRPDLDFTTRGPWGWIWPTIECLPSALLAVTVSLPKKVFGGRDEAPLLLSYSAGETKEAYLALFLMVYLLALRAHLKAAPATR